MTVEPKPGTGICHLCEPAADVPTFDLLNHLRVVHPDWYEPPECWPDGSVVILDETLAPEDFGGAR